MAGHNIIVIGASAGGVEALTNLVRGLPADLPATVFVVLHLAPHSRSLLPQILSRAGALKAVHPCDNEEIKQGRIYVAPPDHHLMILDGHVGAVRGPKESWHRPAVDALFRSAANIYGNRVVGVVLTGNRDDGTAGLMAIKEKGGIAVVQDPAEAYSPGMPESAMKYVSVDHCVPIGRMAALLDGLARDPIEVETRSPVEEGKMATLSDDEAVHNWSGLTCPECNAALFYSKHCQLLEFTCRVGHRFSPDGLLDEQSDTLERTLWLAVNAIEERAALLRLIVRQRRAQRDNESVEPEESLAKENDHHAKQIRRMLTDDGDWYSSVRRLEGERHSLVQEA